MKEQYGTRAENNKQQIDNFHSDGRTARNMYQVECNATAANRHKDQYKVRSTVCYIITVSLRVACTSSSDRERRRGKETRKQVQSTQH